VCKYNAVEVAICTHLDFRLNVSERNDIDPTNDFMRLKEYIDYLVAHYNRFNEWAPHFK